MSGKRCSDKQSYPDQLVAFKALSHCRRKGRNEKRAYRCSHCRGWHLTRALPRLRVGGTWPGAPAGIA